MSRLFDDASSQFLERASAVVNAYPFTMACWFRTDDLTIDQTLMFVGDNTATNVAWRLIFGGVTAGDPVQFGVRAATTESFATTTTGVSVNTWHHACGVATSATDRAAFIDGGSKGTNATSRSPATANVTAIGSRSSSSRAVFMSGRIAEAAIWDVALTDAEVAILAKGASPLMVRPGNLVCYWPLIGRTSPEIDLVSALNLTVTGATAAEHTRMSYLRGPQTAKATAAAGGINGSMSATLGGLTLSAAGQVEVKGTTSQTLAGLTLSAAGTVAVQGTTQATLGGLALSAAGQVQVQGAVSQTLGGLSLLATGGVAVVGSMSATLAGLTLTAAGTVAAAGVPIVELGLTEAQCLGMIRNAADLGARRTVELA